MKKFLLSTLFLIFCAVSAMAEKAYYTDKLYVEVNGIGSTQTTSVSLTLNENGTCVFELPNFILSIEDEGDSYEIPVGNIHIENIPFKQEGEDISFEFNNNLIITNGTKEGVETWLGPTLGEIALKLTGKATKAKCFVSIDIDMMESLGQIIKVTFGNEYALSHTQQYTDDLVVTVNGDSSDPQEASVALTTNEDNTITFQLPNFVLDGGNGDMIGVGNILIENIPVEISDGISTFSFEGKLEISEGNKEGIEPWIGPMLGEIALKLTGKATAEQIFVSIDIDMMESLDQMIYVTFGKDFETGIKQISTTNDIKHVYDLQGRSVNAMQKGLYIVNGKKIIR